MNLKGSDFKCSGSERHSVCYYLYSSKLNNLDEFGIPKDIGKREGECVIKHGSNICFATLLRELTQGKNKVDSLVYLLKRASVKLTQDEIHKWLDMCIKAKVLPDYIKKESDIEGDRYILKLDPSMKLSMLFIYLMCIRWIQEAPIFVRNMTVLVNKYHINFYLAWSVASRMSIGNPWHNIVGSCARYGQSMDKILEDSTFDVSTACGIRNLVLHTNKFDKRLISEMDVNADFLATEKVQLASPKFKSGSIIHIKHVTNNALNKAIESDKDKDLKNILTEINKKK